MSYLRLLRLSNSSFFSISKVWIAFIFIAHVAFLPSFRNKAHWVVHSTLFVALLIKGHTYVI
nr:MAG TPA: hypothetical protein [Caudoviricetes sp.]